MTSYRQTQVGVLSTRYRNLTSFERDLISELSAHLSNVSSILMRGASFGDNMDCRIVEYTTNAVANTEDAVAHTLDKVPTGFLIINKNKAADIYDSGTAWTSSTIYLKCSVASAAVTIIII